MRTFSRIEIESTAKALQNFVGQKGEHSLKYKDYVAATEKALAHGLTLDEIFNSRNYDRALDDFRKEAGTAPNATVNALDYVEYLNEHPLRKEIKQEENWNLISEFYILPDIFHEYFMYMTGNGGEHTTVAAKTLLIKAIHRNSLQAILSEELIKEANEMFKSDNPEAKFTCFQYLTYVLQYAEELHINCSLTKEQTAARFEENDPLTKEEDYEDPIELDTSTYREDGIDQSIYEQKDDEINEDEEDEFMPSTEDETAFLMFCNPQKSAENCKNKKIEKK